MKLPVLSEVHGVTLTQAQRITLTKLAAKYGISLRAEPMRDYKEGPTQDLDDVPSTRTVRVSTVNVKP